MKVNDIIKWENLLEILDNEDFVFEVGLVLKDIKFTKRNFYDHSQLKIENDKFSISDFTFFKENNKFVMSDDLKAEFLINIKIFDVEETEDLYYDSDYDFSTPRIKTLDTFKIHKVKLSLFKRFCRENS